jgi:hypothetical protein
MNSYLDDASVAVLLLISAAYAFSALGPRHLRRRMLAACSAWLARAPSALGLRGAAQRLARAAETKPQGACGGCDNCESRGSPTPGNRAPASGAATEIAAKEFKVPIAGIRRVRR